MPIKAVYVLSCNECGRFPPCERERLATGLPTTASLPQADLCDNEQDATAHAVKLGWCAYPVLCPGCNADYRSKVRREQARRDNPPAEGHGTVREPGQSPQRP